jgi:parallel beta-helix repeat protein
MDKEAIPRRGAAVLALAVALALVLLAVSAVVASPKAASAAPPDPVDDTFRIKDVGEERAYLDAVRLVHRPATTTERAKTERACNLNQRIANAATGQVIDGGGCIERSYVELRKRLTLKNITVKGTDDWTGRFSPSDGNHRSTLTVPEFVEPQQTSDPMNTALCEPQDAAMLCGEAEMVFLDGRYLSQRPNGADPGPGEFALDAGRRVVLGEDPAGKKVEVATRQRGLQLAYGSGGTVLENVDVTQVANTIGKSGTGAALGNGGNALTVRSSEVSWTHGTAFQCGGGVRCEVASSEFHHAGEAGMTSYNASPLLFENNTVRDNCSQTGLPDVAYNDSFVCSGLKITGESPAGRVVAGNVFHHNDHAGVWTDVRANNTKIVRNRIHHNEEQGIHVEISNGIEIHGNVLYENGWVGTQSSASNSAGIYMNTSARILIHDNIMAWNRDGFAFIGNSRGEPTWPWGDSDIYANHIYQANYDQVATHMMNYWLLGDEVNFTGEIMHDNSYYYANQNDDSGTQVGSPVAETTQNRFRYVPTGALQGNHPPYRNLSTFKVDTPVEGGASGYVTRTTATSTLTGAGVPTDTQH